MKTPESRITKIASMVEGDVVIHKSPLTPQNGLSVLDSLVSAGVILSSRSKVTRRSFLTTALIASLGLVLSRTAAAEESQQVVPIEYERSLGRHLSYPWLPLDSTPEGEEATGLNEGGPWDKYDALDRALNGYRARSVYWPQLGGFASTREWLTQVALDTLYEEGEKSYFERRAWAGYCSAAAAAAYFAPKIEGPITVAGIKFTERDRLVIATMRWAGIARNYIALGDIAGRIAEGEPVIVDNSDEEGQQWWGLVRGIRGNSVTITRFLKWPEEGIQTKEKSLGNLFGAYVPDENNSEPGYRGSFAVVDREVGGVILGTHQLID